MLVSLQSRMALLACGVLSLLSGLGVEARPKAGSDVSKRFGDFHILVIANPGNSCADVGEGEMCAYVPDDDPDNAFFGYCGPDLICASNGAICRSDDECFQFCGTDEKCGGLGAQCSSRSTNHYDVNLFTCNTPETICSKDEYGGVCVLNPSAKPRPGARKRSTLPASWSEDDAKLARAARAVALPDDEDLDL